jgi:tetratricopeptide (TPR) repeat protein
LGAKIVSDDLQNIEMSDAAVDRPSQPNDRELRRSKQLKFLLTLLQSVDENNGNADIIYPLLCQNLELLDFDIIEVLKNWATAKFAEVDRYLQEAIAVDIFNFGNLIQKFPVGNKDVNMECSLECYVLTLKIFTSSKDNEKWGGIQHSLAVTYGNRIRGDRAENLEQSIEYYLAALKVRNKKDLPIQWATTQNNLAIAYVNRIKGNRAENLERAIECYRAAIEVRTQADLPFDWAMTQNNLAIAYINRIKGNRAENLERAIECYRAALEIYTPESFPHEWAGIQLNLAGFSIEQLQNYQLATEHLQSAYEHLLANNNDTGLLAQTMFELARCFHKTGCLGQAKIYFKDSIRLYQRLEQPTQVAAATSALGNLELQMGCIDDARIHLQTALEFYQAAGNLDRVASIQELQQCLPEHSPEPAL